MKSEPTSTVQFKLAETLPALIRSKGFNRNRKKICEAIGVSQSSLSQYERGGTLPSLEVAAKLAAFFEVTLDALLFAGERAPPQREVSDEPYFRYIDTTISDVKSQITRHSWLVSEIGDLLAKRIDRVAEEFSSKHLAPNPGILNDKAGYRLETYSDDTFIATTNLMYDIQVLNNQEAVGQFLPVVIQNLKLNRRYRFLLPDGTDWSRHVNALRKTLDANIGDSSLLNNNCQIRKSKTRFPIGYCYYRIDAEELELKEPEFFHRIQPFISDDDYLCYVLPPNNLVQGDILVEQERVEQFLRFIRSSWDDAELL